MILKPPAKRHSDVTAGSSPTIRVRRASRDRGNVRSWARSQGQLVADCVEKVGWAARSGYNRANLSDIVAKIFASGTQAASSLPKIVRNCRRTDFFNTIGAGQTTP